MNKSYYIFSLLFCLFISCSKADLAQDNDCNTKEVAGWFDYLCLSSLGGRYSGSLGIKKSCDYICSVIDASKDSLNVVNFIWDEINLRNIIFHIKGEIDSTLVFGAHYDAYGFNTHSVLPGADDNASGVAVMLCLINWFKKNNYIPRYNIDICFWDGEEIGRLGSNYYVAQLDDYQRTHMIYVNVDTVGSDMYYQVTLGYSDSHSTVSNSFNSLAASLAIPMQKYNPVGFTTDCEPFLRSSIPFYNICCDRLPPYLHKSTDTVSNISFDQIVNIANAIIENIIQ